MLAELLRASLGGSGFDVVQVTTVEGAARELHATNSAVLVVDDDMPLVRGLDVLGRLRTERADFEAVLVTRDEGVASLVTRLHVERLQCLRKPLHLEELRSAVAEAMERQLRRERTSLAPERSISPAPVSGTRIPTRAPAPEPRATSVPPGPDALRVLVVDDDPVVRRSMARTFKRYRVTTAENGKAATAEIERNKPDVIISDLKMPEMDGIQLAQQIRERWPDLADRIVFVSGKNSQIERARAEAPGPPIVTKPVNSAELEARMAEVLEEATRRR